MTDLYATKSPDRRRHPTEPPCAHTHSFWAGIVKTCPHCLATYAPDGQSLIYPPRKITEQEVEK